MLPKQVVILGKTYSITYCDKPSEVDIFKRDSLWGQVDYWTRSIRIYANSLGDEDIFHNILHEILHAITVDLHLDCFDQNDQQKHDELDLVALALTDTLFRNQWIKDELCKPD
jgi:hypothetical protein